MATDIQTDSGFATFMELAQEGRLDSLDANLDLDQMIQKQAYADDDAFADMGARRFSIATAVETEISARYAEKCAHELDQETLNRLDDACVIFGVEKVAKELYPINTTNEMFSAEAEEAEKYAGVNEYGTELDTCLAARALLFPDYAEDLEEMAKMASEVTPQDMVSMIKEADAEMGADLPWLQQRLGSPEYAVFEKRASNISIDLGSKQISFEKLAELDEALNNMGVSIDFDEHDPYTIKMAVERLPKQVKEALAKYVV